MLFLNKVFYGLLAVGLLLIGVFLLFFDTVSLPSRYGALPMSLSPPTTYFVSFLPLSFGSAIILFLIDKDKYDKLCKKIVFLVL